MKTVFIEKELLKYNSLITAGLYDFVSKCKKEGYKIITDELSTEFPDIYGIEKIHISNGLAENAEYQLIFKQDKIVDQDQNIYNNFYEILESGIFSRFAEITRETKETKIKVKVNLDGYGSGKIDTGIGFFDHMLEQISKHGNIYLDVDVKGDLIIDEHHTVEDTGIAIGKSLKKALGDKKGIKRYGYFIPMDESKASCIIDLGGRPFLDFKCKFRREKVGEFPTELTEEFFRGLSNGLMANLHLKCKGKNDHHKIEALFKCFAKALNEACRLDDRVIGLPSTKGVL